MRQRGYGSADIRLERWNLGFTIHPGGPQWTFMGGLNFRLDLDLDWGLGLRMDVGLGLRFSLLLLLHKDLVVQELELSWVPVNQVKTK